MKPTSIFLAVLLGVTMLHGAEFKGWQLEIPENTLRITQIDNPGMIGDIYLIQAPDGTVTLLDTGLIETGESILIPALDRRGIRRIDQVIISHQHSDHWGGLPTLLADPEITVKSIVWSPLPPEKIEQEVPEEAPTEIALERSILALAERKNIPVRAVTTGDTLHFGSGIDVPVIGAARPEVVVPNCQNNNSIVFRLVYGDFSMLFTGDQGFEQEDAVLASGAEVAADVLKAGHHAGAGSTGEAFLAAVAPKIVVVTMPEWLSSDPRGLRVEKQLQAGNYPFYRSWEYGDFTIYSDGKTFALVKDFER